jgi:hypothetical protein
MLAAPYQYSRETAQIAVATPIRVLSPSRPEQTVVIPEDRHSAAWEAPVVRRHCPLWELSLQSQLVIPIQTPRLTFSGGPRGGVPKLCPEANPGL